MKVYNVVKTIIDPKTEIPTTEIISTRLTYLGAKHFLANYLLLDMDDALLILSEKPFIFDWGDGTEEHEDWKTYYSIVESAAEYSIIPSSLVNYSWRVFRDKSKKGCTFVFFDREKLNYLESIEVKDEKGLLYSHLSTDIYNNLVYFEKIAPDDVYEEEE